jgi:2-aminoethylphosphonate-pyruvate transaminase
MNFQSFAPAGFRGPEGQEDMPYLLTPGPVTTSLMVRLAAMADWCAADNEFAQFIKSIREKLLELAACDDSYECVLMPGPSSHVAESVLVALAPGAGGKTLILSNGRTADAAVPILQRLKRPFLKIDKKDNRAFAKEDIEPLLNADKTISHVWMVHCETEKGIVNPVADVARAVKADNRVLIVDATASFGALPVSMVKDEVDVLVSSSDVCLEGTPGVSFALLKQSLLLASEGKSHSIALDLHAQWTSLEQGGLFRTTPPTHTIAAFSKALQELAEEGGPEARLARYEKTATALFDGMKAAGFQPLLRDADPCPVVQAFRTPRDPNFSFNAFRKSLRARGFAIQEGTQENPAVFTIATAGTVNSQLIERLCTEIKVVLNDMEVRDFKPAEKHSG